VNGNSGLSWKANTCLLSKGHKDRSEEECDHKVSNNALLYEYMQLSDPVEEQNAPQVLTQAAPQKKFGEGEEFTAAMAKLNNFKKKYKTTEAIPEKEIPAAYDLRNIDGFDFTGKVRDQEGCGSCYTMSFIQAVESRIKSNIGKDVEQLSP